jgi:hypothetical protein
MATIERRRQDDQAHEQIMVVLAEVKKDLQVIKEKQIEAEKFAAGRAHLDDMVRAHDDVMRDNGKQGLLSIRNEWILLKGKVNSIQVAIIIQILAFITVEFLTK